MHTHAHTHACTHTHANEHTTVEKRLCVGLQIFIIGLERLVEVVTLYILGAKWEESLINTKGVWMNQRIHRGHSPAAGDLVNQRSGASPPQARGTGGKQGSAQQHPESGQWNLGADWDPTEGILHYRPLAGPKVPEEGGKVGKLLPCVYKTSSRSGPFPIKIRMATPLKSVVPVTTQNSVYGKSAEMSIPTHTELTTSQEKLLNNRMLYR